MFDENNWILLRNLDSFLRFRPWQQVAALGSILLLTPNSNNPQSTQNPHSYFLHNPFKPLTRWTYKKRTFVGLMPWLNPQAKTRTRKAASFACGSPSFDLFHYKVPPGVIPTCPPLPKPRAKSSPKQWWQKENETFQIKMARPAKMVCICLPHSISQGEKGGSFPHGKG